MRPKNTGTNAHTEIPYQLYFVAAIYNSSGSPVTITATDIVNTASFPLESTATDITIAAGGTVVIQTALANNNYLIQAINNSGSVYTPYKYSKEWHIDPVNGLDTNVGGEETPFLTIGQAQNVATSGDAIILHPGTYTIALEVNNDGVDFLGLGTAGSVIVNNASLLIPVYQTIYLIFNL